MGQKPLARSLMAPPERRILMLRGYKVMMNLDLAAMETKYDAQFKVVFDAIRELMAPPPVPPGPRIGFTRPKAELAAAVSQ